MTVQSFRTLYNVPDGVSRSLAERAAETVNVRDFGAHPVYSSEANRSAFQRAAARIALVGKPARFFIPGSGDREYAIADEIDFSALVAGQYVHAAGDGTDVSVIKPDSFGRLKKLLKFGGSKGARIGGPHISALTILGNNNIDDPIGVYAPWLSNARWSFKLSALDNIGAFIEECDNSFFEQMVFTGCGYQYLQGDSSSAVYAGCNGTTLTAYSDTAGTTIPGFFTGREGQEILVERGDTSVVASDGIWARRTISSVTGDGSECEVDVAYTRTFTYSAAVKLSYGPLLGGITSGTNQLTISRAAYTSDDIGRPIFIPRAGGSNKSVLATTITAVSGTTITLADNAGATVSNAEIWNAPSLVVGHMKSNLVAGDVTNGLRINGIHIFSHDGPGALFMQGVNTHIDNGYFEGKQPTQNHTARSRHNIVASAADLSLASGNYFSYARVGGHPTLSSALNDGSILVLGDRVTSRIFGIWNAMPDNQYPIHMDTIDANAETQYGGVVGSGFHKSMVRRGASASIRQVKPGPVSYIGTAGDKQVSQGRSAVRMTVGVDALKYFDPEFEVGLLCVASGTLVSSVMEYMYTGWIRTGYHSSGTNVAPAIQSGGGSALVSVATIAKASADVVLSDGTASKLSFLLCTDGIIVIVNRRTSSITFNIGIQQGA